MKRYVITTAAIAMLSITVLAGCTEESNTQDKSQKITESYQKYAENGVPYPLAKMKAGGWLERKLRGLYT